MCIVLSNGTAWVGPLNVIRSCLLSFHEMTISYQNWAAVIHPNRESTPWSNHCQGYHAYSRRQTVSVNSSSLKRKTREYQLQTSEMKRDEEDRRNLKHCQSLTQTNQKICFNSRRSGRSSAFFDRNPVFSHKSFHSSIWWLTVINKVNQTMASTVPIAIAVLFRRRWSFLGTIGLDPWLFVNQALGTDKPQRVTLTCFKMEVAHLKVLQTLRHFIIVQTRCGSTIMVHRQMFIHRITRP